MKCHDWQLSSSLDWVCAWRWHRGSLSTLFHFLFSSCLSYLYNRRQWWHTIHLSYTVYGADKDKDSPVPFLPAQPHKENNPVPWRNTQTPPVYTGALSCDYGSDTDHSPLSTYRAEALLFHCYSWYYCIWHNLKSFCYNYYFNCYSEAPYKSDIEAAPSPY